MLLSTQTVYILRRPDGSEAQGTKFSIEDVWDGNGAFVDYELKLVTQGGVMKEWWKGYFDKK